jgi:hypothetical protein
VLAGVARTAGGLQGCPGFGPFWAALTVSSFGTYVTTLAVQVLVVLTLRGGAAEVGLVSAGDGHGQRERDGLPAVDHPRPPAGPVERHQAVGQPGDDRSSARRWAACSADAVGYRPMLYAAAAGFGLVSTCLAASPYRHARPDDAAAAIE